MQRIANHRHARRACLLAVVSGALACGTASAPLRTDETSAEGHRAEAERERAAAAREQAQYVPSAIEPVSNSGHDFVEGTPGPSVFINPTTRHLSQADQHLAHARAHEQAAQRLERFEDAACAGIAPAVRAGCPLIHSVVALQNVTQGVRLQFESVATADTAYAHMRCHAAYARTRGFDPAAAACPLYVRGIRIVRVPKSKTVNTFVDILGDAPAVAREIQTTSRDEIQTEAPSAAKSGSLSLPTSQP